MLSSRSWSNGIVLVLVGATVVVTAAATALAALAQPEPRPAPPQVPIPKPTGESTMQLSGPTWQWLRSEYSNDTSVIAGDPKRYTIEFLAAGRLAIRADCNRVQGSYTQNGTQLTIQLGPTTLVACPPDSQADVFLKDLSATATHVFSGDQLVLNMKLDTGNMIFSALPAPELAGPVWELRSYNNGRGAVVSVLPQPVSTANFTTDGQLHGSAGCNSFQGSYTVNGRALTIGPLATTRMMCEPQVMQQEQAYLAALQASTRYDFDADRLLLFDASGARQADFAPAEAPTG